MVNSYILHSFMFSWIEKANKGNVENNEITKKIVKKAQRILDNWSELEYA